ncbi:ABC-type multidrug transport system fused ATPase/permease subunit [Bradyrhizobium sp. LM6.10]
MTTTTTDHLRAGAAGSFWLRLAAMALPLMMIAPAFWNGYPLLQWDTGGYLARWYEGYLVPSRSTVFGLYLHYGESFGFWINLAVQSVATLWLLQLTLRVLGLMQTFRFVAICLLLILSTALPWLASMLLTDIFAGLSVLSLFLLVVAGPRTSVLEKISLFVFTAFAAATHSATLGVLLGLCVAGWMVRPLLRRRLPIAGLAQASMTIVAGGLMLVSANHALSGKWAWTPGGYGVAFGRMMQDGIVARYLNDHCPRERYKLCPYRNELPATADEFLWGKSMFNTLGRFEGMSDEMGTIVVHSLADYPAWQAGAALRAMGQQLLHVATGEGTNGWIPHTYGVIERYIPAQVAQMRAARQQHWAVNFDDVNWLHVPVALASMLALVVLLALSLRNRRLDDLTLLAATVGLALLGNAFICGVISGPHDRYGARMVWVATFVVLMALARRLSNDEPADETSAAA